MSAERAKKPLTEAQREMARLRSAEWRRANPERYRQQMTDYYAQNHELMKARSRLHYRENIATRKASARRAALKSLYGLTPEDRDRMSAAQGNACTICRESFERTPSIDHDHVTGKVRGLLCNTCNTTLGKLGDTLESVRERTSAMITYLERARG